MTENTPEGDRIAKVLSRAGIASRREAERMIAEGRVSVNGKVIDSPALNIQPKDRIAVDGKLVGEPDPPRIWLYHKPAGLVTTERDEKDRPTVFAALPEDMPRVMSVGRLDLNSEGLLLLTNDGEVKRRLELPSTGWLRRYRVRINGSVSEDNLDKLRKGITVDGLTYQPMLVTFDRQQGANAWLTVSLREGKNREIRRAMEAINVTVNRLIRVSYGPFQLGNLGAGEVEEIKARVIRDQLGLVAEDTDKPRPQRTRKTATAVPKSDRPKSDGPKTDRPKTDRPIVRGGGTARIVTKAARTAATGPKPAAKPVRRGPPKPQAEAEAAPAIKRKPPKKRPVSTRSDPQGGKNRPK